MSISPSGIAFEELENSPRISITPDGVLAVRRLLAPWDRWDALAQELFGVAHDVAGSLVLVEPLPFPGECPNLTVESLDVEPFDPGNPDGRDVATLTSGANRYAGGALLTVRYRQRFEHGQDYAGNPLVPPGTYLTYSAEFSTEHRTIDSLNWRWAGTTINVPATTTVGVLVTLGQHTLVWHRVPRPPYEAIRSLRGKVNESLFLSAAPGTLLFNGARLSRQFQMRGETSIWRIEYSFSEKRQAGGDFGWNYFFRKDADPHWAAVETADAPHDPPYASGEFAALFRME